MNTAVATKTKPPAPRPAPRAKGQRLPSRSMPPPVSVRRIAPWPAIEEEDDSAKPERGPDAVQHSEETRGRRSRLFPDLHITATAAKLGITKSHLAKVLAGQNRPSLDLAKRIADALQKDLTFVVALGDNSFRQQDAEPKELNQKRKRVS